MLSTDQRKAAAAHIRQLAKTHKIKIHWTKTYESSEADLATRQVFVPKRLDRGIDYLAALHEIGHIVDSVATQVQPSFRYATGRDMDYEYLITEAAAWAWALRVALKDVTKGCTKGDWRKVGECWASHAGPIW